MILFCMSLKEEKIKTCGIKTDFMSNISIDSSMDVYMSKIKNWQIVNLK